MNKWVCECGQINADTQARCVACNRPAPAKSEGEAGKAPASSAQGLPQPKAGTVREPDSAKKEVGAKPKETKPGSRWKFRISALALLLAGAILTCPGAERFCAHLGGVESREGVTVGELTSRDSPYFKKYVVLLERKNFVLFSINRYEVMSRAYGPNRASECVESGTYLGVFLQFVKISS